MAWFQKQVGYTEKYNNDDYTVRNTGDWVNNFYKQFSVNIWYRYTVKQLWLIADFCVWRNNNSY